MTGVVSSFDERAGLGVVSAPTGDYPFHCTQIADGSRTIAPGQAVDFELIPGRLGRWEAGAIRTGSPC